MLVRKRYHERHKTVHVGNSRQTNFLSIRVTLDSSPQEKGTINSVHTRTWHFLPKRKEKNGHGWVRILARRDLPTVTVELSAKYHWLDDTLCTLSRSYDRVRENPCKCWRSMCCCCIRDCAPHTSTYHNYFSSLRTPHPKRLLCAHRL